VPIDFELTEEQKLIQQTAREFALKEIQPKAKEIEQKHEFPWEIYRKCGQQGFLGMTWPEEYGGQGVSIMEAMLVVYELVKADPPVSAAVLAGTFGADMIAESGTQEQKAKWLPRLARGEITSAGCFTEPGGGSDISRVLDTRAERVGNEWVINGTKQFITNGTTASVFVTLTQTDTKVERPYRGQTEFVIERSDAIEARKYEDKMGWLASPTCEVRFNGVRVKDEDILGGPPNLNRGFYLGLMFLDFTRAAVGWQGLATAEAALQRALSYCGEREAFGRKIGGFQALAFRLVEMATQVEMLKSLCFRSAWLVMKAREDPGTYGEESVRVASMAKWFGAKTAVQACDLAMDVLAGYGYVESDIDRWYRFAKCLEIIEGTKEVQKNAIARLMLGREMTKTF
jgi:alkylation response protein AidB-like acyl-CoA dehydrogenase